MTKVYIVDDHAVVIEGIYSLLQKEKDFDMVKVRMKMLKDILAQYGFLQGKM